ncbi:MAG: hypothetical protein A2X85_05375 [Geobacteraceae bacterium GWF2_54_21]|nr:MAG: hypothetical protein A2X85_05375 [Geobacteraceae bacterium GWF2_54_21]
MIWRIFPILLAIVFSLLASAPALAQKLDLTVQEKQWLADHPKIRVGVMAAWAPLSFVTRDGEAQGLAIDYVEAINRQLDGALLPQPGRFKDNYDRVLDGRLDAMMDLTSRPEREPLFIFTRPYISIPHVLVGRKSGPYFASEADLAGRTVALERGFYAITHFSKNYPSVAIREYNSTSEALDAVSRGEADAYAGNRAVVIHVIEEEYLNNLRLMGRLENSRSVLQIGVGKDKPLLASILDKALQSIPESEHTAIYNRWVGVKYETGFDYSLVWKVVAASLVVILLFVYRNRRLVKEIIAKKQTEEELTRNRDQLEALVKERSLQLEERMKVGNELKTLTGRLEERVRERTAELEKEIDERIRSERAAIASEQRFRALFNNLGDSVYITDMAGNIVAANAQASRELGCSNQELLELNIIDLDAVFTTPESVAEHFKALAESKSMTFETIHRRKDGSQFSVEINVRLIDFDGRQSVMGIARNISARRQAERDASSARQQLEVIFDTMQAGIMLVSPLGTITFANQRMASMFGCKLDELIGSSYVEHVHPGQRGVGDERMRRLIAGEIDHVHHERHYIRKDGSSFWGHLSGRRLEDEQGNLISLVGVVADISEMKKMHEALDYTNQCFTQALSGGQHILYRLNVKKGCYDYLSPAFERLTGYPVAEFSRISLEQLPEYFHPDDRQRIFNYIDEQLASRTGRSVNFDVEYRFRKADGSYCWFHDTNTAVFNEQDELECFFGSVHDISDRKQAEEERFKLEQQLLNAQKLESLGVLAGGIAHDFNNILTAIIGNADLALMRLNQESPVVDNLHRIEHAAARAAELAKQMLAYSGKGKFVVENLDLNRLLEDMLHILEVSISKKAVPRFNLTSPLPTVEADASQMRQLIMNLMINASEAIGDKSGVIAVSTGCMECDESYLKDVWLDEKLDPGLYVCLEISDNGCGMDRETMSKLFDPFFTTKFTGRGLGMAAVLGIVRGHRGVIKVYSEPGKGSSFKILLPAAGRLPEVSNTGSGSADWRGSGTVLLVDDEETVRGIAGEMLRELGFEVVTANDGREALEVFKANPVISLVLLDLTMPHMDGEQCFRELRRMKPEVKVIMSSGYNEYEVTQKFAGKGLAGFIQKPYRLSVLRETFENLERVKK